MTQTVDRIISAMVLVLAAAACVWWINAASSGCTPSNRQAFEQAFGQLAGEVCVEGDTFGACLKKCAAAEEQRSDAGGGGAAP